MFEEAETPSFSRKTTDGLTLETKIPQKDPVSVHLNSLVGRMDLPDTRQKCVSLLGIVFFLKSRRHLHIQNFPIKQRCYF